MEDPLVSFNTFVLTNVKLQKKLPPLRPRPIKPTTNFRNTLADTLLVRDQLWKDQREQADAEKQSTNSNDVDNKKQSEMPTLHQANPNVGKQAPIDTDNLTADQEAMVKAAAARNRDFIARMAIIRAKRRLDNLRDLYPYLTLDEVKCALQLSNDDDDECARRLLSPNFVSKLRELLTTKVAPAPVQQTKYTVNARAALASANARANRTRNLANRRADSALVKSRIGRLALDKALDNAKEGNFEGWSEARIKAYKTIDTNPNAYYYRFNKPGEVQRDGKWSLEEQKLFFEVMKTHPPNHKWGIFSMHIPGRVGYQCSNFYRSQIKQGKIKDDNYILDEKGRPRYLFKNKSGRAEIRVHSKKHDGSDQPSQPTNNAAQMIQPGVTVMPVAAAPPKPKRAPKPKKAKVAKAPKVKKPKAKPKKKKKRGRGMGDVIRACDVDSEEDDDPIPRNTAKRMRSALGVGNPLPDYLDPITKAPVVAPMMSPYGHVMGKETWMLCLEREPKNRCPLTKQPVSKRELVQLTEQNIEMYRDRLILT